MVTPSLSPKPSLASSLPLPSPMAGYSGTPLPKKLGIKAGHRIALLHAPEGFDKTLGDLPDDTAVAASLAGKHPLDVIVLFVKSRGAFEKELPKAAARLADTGGLWIAWPKKASKVPTDMTEDVIREVALPGGLSRQQGLRDRRRVVGVEARGCVSRIAASACDHSSQEAHRAVGPGVPRGRGSHEAEKPASGSPHSGRGARSTARCRVVTSSEDGAPLGYSCACSPSLCELPGGPGRRSRDRSGSIRGRGRAVRERRDAHQAPA